MKKKNETFVDGLLSHNYDTDYVHELLLEGKLDLHSALYVLENANKVIINLRAQNTKTIDLAAQMIEIDKNSLVSHGKRK